jgi:two-component system nitrogen regulation response regulator GlnG
MFEAIESYGFSYIDYPLAGRSQELKDIIKGCIDAADDLRPVYVYGEAGSGRHSIAEFLHHITPVTGGEAVSMVPVTYHEKQLREILFGKMEAHLFTADTVLKGLCYRASQGTLIIPNIEYIPPTVQMDLLHLLQFGHYRPVGSKESFSFVGRVVLLSFSPAERLAEEKRLLPELYQLIESRSFFLPPLRKRRDDIDPLVRYFTEYFANIFSTGHKTIARKTIRALERRSWNGNTAELAQWIARAIMNTSAAELLPSHFPDLMRDDLEHYNSDQLRELALEEVIDMKISLFLEQLGRFDTSDLHKTVMAKAERPLIYRVLKKCKGNQLKASSILGINRNTLRQKIKEHNIDLTSIKNHE